MLQMMEKEKTREDGQKRQGMDWQWERKLVESAIRFAHLVQLRGEEIPCVWEGVK